MQIKRHRVDPGHAQGIFSDYYERLPKHLEAARQLPAPSPTLVDVVESICEAGAVVAPDSIEMACALRLTAQAYAALFAFVSIEDPPRYIRLGDGLPITYSKPTPGGGKINGGHWAHALGLSFITRQPDVLQLLLAVRADLFRRWTGPYGEPLSMFADIHRALFTEGYVTKLPEFAALEARRAADCVGRSAEARANRLTRLPYLEVLRALDRGEPVEFNQVLTQAVRQHKEYWSSSEAQRKNPDGWVSFILTAVAALAHTRGLEVTVESDYLPHSWITGELFRRT